MLRQVLRLYHNYFKTTAELPQVYLNNTKIFLQDYFYSTLKTFLHCNNTKYGLYQDNLKTTLQLP